MILDNTIDFKQWEHHNGPRLLYKIWPVEDIQERKTTHEKKETARFKIQTSRWNDRQRRYNTDKI